jgi:serpin B
MAASQVMMRKAALLVVAMFVAACSGAPASPPPPISPSPTPSGSPSLAPSAVPSPSPIAIAQVGEIRSNVARQPVGSATAEQLVELAAQDADFAFRLYHQITQAETGNVFISPYSISTALSMTYAGARGNTAAEMAEVMGIWPDAAAWHAARNRLELKLAALPRQPHYGEGERVPFTLEPVNTMFGQAGFPFEADFLDVLAASYGAGMQTVDFATATEAARQAINAWVADKTHERIPELLKAGDLNSWTVFALVNAIYFRANWQNQFDPEQTRSEPFQMLDGATRDVEMMHGVFEVPYARGDGWQAVSLPYWGAEMVVVVPDEGRFDEIESEVDAAFLEELASGLEENEVTLGLPRWESETRAYLIPALQALGITDLFVPGAADLTGIADADGLFVTNVIHQANITVDEEGTEAAAATVVIGGFICACGPDASVTLTIDRPFLYFIRDQAAGEILFMGRLLEP